MADPVWLDNNTVIRTWEGNALFVTDLKARIAAGHKLLIVPAVRQEFLYGNPLTMDPKKPDAAQRPDVATRESREKFLKSFGIEVDTAGGRLSMQTRVGLNVKDYPLNPNAPPPKP